MSDGKPRCDASGLTQLASAYTPSEAALLISVLEGAGFDVFVPGYHMMANAQHFSIAFGGAKVMVPAVQAEDAAALLAQIQTNATQATQDVSPAPSPNWFKRILTGAVYWFTGTAPALSGRFLSVRDKAVSSDHERD